MDDSIRSSFRERLADDAVRYHGRHLTPMWRRRDWARRCSGASVGLTAGALLFSFATNSNMRIALVPMAIGFATSATMRCFDRLSRERKHIYKSMMDLANELPEEIDDKVARDTLRKRAQLLVVAFDAPQVGSRVNVSDVCANWSSISRALDAQDLAVVVK